jgi:anti-sigma factor RsiW
LNCYQMKMLLPPYENDELPEQERQVVELHLAGCASCRAALEEVKALHSSLSLLHTISVDTRITDQIITRIRKMKKLDRRETEAETDGLEPGESEEIRSDAPTEFRYDANGHLLPGWDET